MGPWATWSGTRSGGRWPRGGGGGLELDDPQGPFQPKPFNESVNTSTQHLAQFSMESGSVVVSGVALCCWRRGLR